MAQYKIIECNVPSKYSARVYTTTLVQTKILNNPKILELLNSGALYVENDWNNYTEGLDLQKVIGVITKLYMVDNVLYAEAESFPGHSITNIYIRGYGEIDMVHGHIRKNNKMYECSKHRQFVTEDSFELIKFTGDDSSDGLDFARLATI